MPGECETVARVRKIPATRKYRLAGIGAIKLIDLQPGRMNFLLQGLRRKVLKPVVDFPLPIFFHDRVFIQADLFIFVLEACDNAEVRVA